MEMSSLSAASAYGATHIAQMNSAASNAFHLSALPPLVPPGNSLGECVDFSFSGQFRKYINASTATPPLTTVGNINEYLSSCVCKIYNETFPSFKDISSNVLKNVASNPPPAPPQYYNVYTADKLPPIFQNISFYFFKGFIPYVENQPRENSTLGKGTNFGINFLQEYANTLIGIDLSHYFAQGSTPATNTLDASIRCSGKQIGWAKADPRMVDLVKNLCIQHFKKMGVKVYVNDKPI